MKKGGKIPEALRKWQLKNLQKNFFSNLHIKKENIKLNYKINRLNIINILLKKIYNIHIFLKTIQTITKS